MREAYLYTKHKQGVRCNACMHECLLKNNQLGVCGVRANIDNKLYSLVYGKPLAVAIDPIEKKPLFHFYPGKPILSIGTFGCNFRCSFCQNYEMSQTTKNKTVKEAIEIINKYSKSLEPEQIVELAISQDIDMIAYTYNEPTVFAEYFLDTARIAKRHGIRNVLVSNGYYSEELRRRIPRVIDAVNIDLKSFRQEFYSRIVGAKLRYVLENIEYLKKHGVWVELTTLVIPGENDSDEELRSIAKWISNLDKSIPWHISRFFPSYKMLDKPITPVDTLETAYSIGKQYLDFVYIGNYPSDKENTYCPSCGALLIERNLYTTRVVDLDLNKGVCKKCGARISGMWK